MRFLMWPENGGFWCCTGLKTAVPLGPQINPEQRGGHNFYPDFVVRLKDGRILIVEYKGKSFLNDDTREEENIGQLWEEKSQGKGLFLLATWMEAEGRYTQRQIDEKIRHGK